MDSEIDWDDYDMYTDEWRDHWLKHDVKGCRAKIEMLWCSIGDAIELAKEHHEVCPLNV